MTMTVPMQAHEARVNVTYKNRDREPENFELPDPVAFVASDADIKGWVSEAIRTGSIPGIVADPNVDLTGYVVDRFPAPANPAPGQRNYAMLQIRPKTEYGL
jgi:hypothetical protein